MERVSRIHGSISDAEYLVYCTSVLLQSYAMKLKAFVWLARVSMISNFVLSLLMLRVVGMAGLQVRLFEMSDAVCNGLRFIWFYAMILLVTCLPIGALFALVGGAFLACKRLYDVRSAHLMLGSLGYAKNIR